MKHLLYGIVDECDETFIIWNIGWVWERTGWGGGTNTWKQNQNIRKGRKCDRRVWGKYGKCSCVSFMCKEWWVECVGKGEGGERMQDREKVGVGSWAGVGLSHVNEGGMMNLPHAFFLILHLSSPSPLLAYPSNFPLLNILLNTNTGRYLPPTVSLPCILSLPSPLPYIFNPPLLSQATHTTASPVSRPLFVSPHFLDYLPHSLVYKAFFV